MSTITKQDLIDFKKLEEDSPFRKTKQDLHITLRYGEALHDMRHHIEDLDLVKATPPFQRANNKWTKKMQISYVENIVVGCENNIILLFNLEEDYIKHDHFFTNCFILDGLQRLTALFKFFNNQLKIFGKYYYKDICMKINPTTHILLRNYRFNNMEEAVRFYIQMNENITHSKKDIQKAKDWLFETHGVSL